MISELLCVFFFFTGNTRLEDCLPCMNGSYCEGTANTKPTDLCDATFYCPAGQKSKQPFPCTAGHYCPGGSPRPILCESGTWQDEPRKDHCKECPQGFFCDRKNGPITDFSVYPCPNGFYCPNGTKFANEFGCPNGTYGNGTNLVRASQCLPCPPGKYCLGKFF